MNLPRFFLSYAHDDNDNYLQKFFKDLCDRLRAKGFDEASFRDLVDIKAGEDWEKRVGDALRTSQILLALYTPWYFRSEYCGKELMVFLERQPWVRYDEDGAVRDSKRIIPVLWGSQRDLERLGLPPAVLRYIQYAIGDDPNYKAKGLKTFLRRGWVRYDDILDELADLLADHFADQPIDPYPEVTPLTAVRSLFAPGGALHPVPGGPGVLSPLYLAADDAAVDGWRLAPDGSRSVRSMVAEAALSQGFQCMDRRFDPASGSAVDEVLAELRGATGRNEIPVVVVEPALAGEEALPLLQRIVSSTEWRGGVAIVANPAHPAAAAAVEKVRTALHGVQVNPEQIVVREILAGREDDLSTAFISLLHDVRRRVVGAGSVQRPVSAREGPREKPLLGGPRAESSL